MLHSSKIWYDSFFSFEIIELLLSLNLCRVYVNTSNKQSGFKVYIRLLQYVKPHWKIFILSILGYMLYSGSQPLLAEVTGWLTNAAYTKDTQ